MCLWKLILEQAPGKCLGHKLYFYDVMKVHEWQVQVSVQVHGWNIFRPHCASVLTSQYYFVFFADQDPGKQDWWQGHSIERSARFVAEEWRQTALHWQGSWFVPVDWIGIFLSTKHLSSSSPQLHNLPLPPLLCHVKASLQYSDSVIKKREKRTDFVVVKSESWQVVLYLVYLCCKILNTAAVSVQVLPSKE